MSVYFPARLLLPLVALLLGLLPTAHGTCAACANYAQDLSTCSNEFSQAVTNPSTGTISPTGISCMCVTGAGLQNMVNCYQCGQLAGFDLALLETWIVACNTDNVSGAGAALACWNTDQSLCVPLQGVDTPGSASSAAPAATAGGATMTATAQGIAPTSTASSPPNSSSASSSAGRVASTGASKSGAADRILRHGRVASVDIVGVVGVMLFILGLLLF